MMRLTRAPTVIAAQHWINVLQNAGIPCEMHNRFLGGALGEIPADQCAPEIWLLDERDEAVARRLLDAAMSGPQGAASAWRCRRCGETLEAQFTSCWQCGEIRDPRE
jgi:hypothetical protein